MIDRHHTALLLVDLQYDFMPGGALAVAGGDEILGPIRSALEEDLFGVVVATQDWHPPKHASFASRHSGRKPFDTIPLHGHEQVLWPDHCVAGTPGAELRRDLGWERVSAIIRKGTNPEVDSYSGFRNNWDERGRRPPTGLAGYLRENGITDVYICGLARDFCVKWTAEDAADLGFAATVLWDLTRAVDPAHDAAVSAALRGKGVAIGEWRAALKAS
jgi:nicotinamidase/pyrazinamidase